jgi:hypothetical protein
MEFWQRIGPWRDTALVAIAVYTVLVLYFLPVRRLDVEHLARGLCFRATAQGLAIFASEWRYEGVLWVTDERVAALKTFAPSGDVPCQASATPAPGLGTIYKLNLVASGAEVNALLWFDPVLTPLLNAFYPAARWNDFWLVSLDI